MLSISCGLISGGLGDWAGHNCKSGFKVGRKLFLRSCVYTAWTEILLPSCGTSNQARIAQGWKHCRVPMKEYDRNVYLAAFLLVLGSILLTIGISLYVKGDPDDSGEVHQSPPIITTLLFTHVQSIQERRCCS